MISISNISPTTSATFPKMWIKDLNLVLPTSGNPLGSLQFDIHPTDGVNILANDAKLFYAHNLVNVVSANANVSSLVNHLTSITQSIPLVTSALQHIVINTTVPSQPVVANVVYVDGSTIKLPDILNQTSSAGLSAIIPEIIRDIAAVFNYPTS